jgi:hypothetical protein
MLLLDDDDVSCDLIFLWFAAVVVLTALLLLLMMMMKLLRLHRLRIQFLKDRGQQPLKFGGLISLPLSLIDGTGKLRNFVYKKCIIIISFITSVFFC